MTAAEFVFFLFFFFIACHFVFPRSTAKSVIVASKEIRQSNPPKLCLSAGRGAFPKVGSSEYEFHVMLFETQNSMVSEDLRNAVEVNRADIQCLLP